MWTNCKRLMNNINTNTIICAVYKSHYEALNIPRTATHKEIKDAYYRLSMIYHPDKNKGSKEAANIFRDITSAYEVLGNVRQRGLYDRGANPIQKNSQYTSRQPFETMNTKTDLYKTNAHSRDYNFNEWSRTHYTNVYERQFSDREKILHKKFNEEYVMRHNTYIVLTVMVSVIMFILVTMFEYVKELLIARLKINTASKKIAKND